MSEVVDLNQKREAAEAERAKAKLPKISILTPTYKRHDLMAAALRSVAGAAVRYPFEWIVMDNGGSQDLLVTEKLMKECLQLELRQERACYAGDNKMNFSEMNNDMAKRASGKYLLFLNNDIVAIQSNDFIAPLVELLENDPGLGAAGSILVYPTKALQHAGVIITSELEPINVSENSTRFLNLFPTLYDHDRYYQAATGACLLVRREDFNAIGGFCTCFNWAYEDVDLCLRLRAQLGKETVVSCKSVLIHKESQSSAKPHLRNMLKLFRETWTGYLRGDGMAYQSDFRRYFAPKSLIEEMTEVTNDAKGE